MSDLAIRHALTIMRLVEALREIALECDPSDPEWRNPSYGRSLIWKLATEALDHPGIPDEMP